MELFRTKPDKNTLDLLDKSKVDFKYDITGIKTRLLISIEDQQMSLAEKKIRELTHSPIIQSRRIAIGLMVAVLIVAGTGTALVQADVAKPGDKLHAIDLLGEKILLNLPMPAAQKAKIQAEIIDERNKELEYLIQNNTQIEIRTQAVKQSQTELSNAVEQVKNVQELMISKGKTQQAEKLNQVLIKLQTLAEEQEKKVESLTRNESDHERQVELQQRLENIRKSKIRAKVEIK